MNFLKVAEGVDVLPLAVALARQPDLFGRNRERKYAPGTPHSGMSDIWLRYNDRAPFDAGARPWSQFNDLHEPVWYPEAALLPEARPIVFGLMARFQGVQLGGVLITKLAPGAKVETHVDSGWHASRFSKFYVAIDHAPGAKFGFPDGVIEARIGDIFWFRNDVPHWVENGGDRDRIAMICCIQT